MKYDRRLYSPGPDLKGPESFSKLPVRICLGSAFGLMLALMAFVWFTGSAVMYVHFWAYLAVVALIVLLLLTAGVFGICHRIESERTRRTAGIIIGSFVAMLGVMAIMICHFFAESYLVPVGFDESPEGENRIVIMRTIAEEGDAYTAYPAIGNHFYIVLAEPDIVVSDGVIQGVHWEGERKAVVTLTDIEGNDATLTVDFEPLYGGDTEETAPGETATE